MLALCLNTRSSLDAGTMPKYYILLGYWPLPTHWNPPSILALSQISPSSWVLAHSARRFFHPSLWLPTQPSMSSCKRTLHYSWPSPLELHSAWQFCWPTWVALLPMLLLTSLLAYQCCLQCHCKRKTPTYCRYIRRHANMSANMPAICQQ